MPSSTPRPCAASLPARKTPYRDIAVLNAAAGLVVAGKADSLRHGAEMAARAIDDGAVRSVLDRLVLVSNR